MPNNDHQQLRQFIQNAFSDEELGNFCFDYFPQIYNEFTTGMLKSQKIRMLVAHAESGSRLPDLHAALKRENPRAYDNTFPDGEIPAQQEPQKSITRNPRLIFISHASKDANFAHQLAADLRKQGWQTWIAPESIRPGEKWVEAINRGLAESSVVVLVLTPASVNSSYVRDETNFAIELMRHGEPVRVIPIELEQVSPAEIPFTWSPLQRIMFRGEYHKGLAGLLQELDPEAEDQTPPSSPAKQPESKSVREESMIVVSEQDLPQKKATVRSPTKAIRPRFWQWLRNLPPVVWVSIVGMLFVVFLVIFWPNEGKGPDETPTVTPDQESVPQVTDTAIQAITPTLDSNVLPVDAELGDTWMRPKDGMVMVYVPPPDAPFVLESGVEAPTEGYWFDKYEVSNAQYQKCVDAGACEPAEYIGDERFNEANYPVVGVSAFDAEVYSTWVGGVLPTEAEWEYAAVGNSGFDYPWGDEFDGTRLNCFEDDCNNDYEWTAPVDSFPKGASWVGALNMVSNVSEWTSSFVSEGDTGRIRRGGSWDYSYLSAQPTIRAQFPPEARVISTGFRVVVRRPPSQ